MKGSQGADNATYTHLLRFLFFSSDCFLALLQQGLLSAGNYKGRYGQIRTQTVCSVHNANSDANFMKCFNNYKSVVKMT